MKKQQFAYVRLKFLLYQDFFLIYIFLFISFLFFAYLPLYIYFSSSEIYFLIVRELDRQYYLRTKNVRI